MMILDTIFTKVFYKTVRVLKTTIRRCLTIIILIVVEYQVFEFFINFICIYFSNIISYKILNENRIYRFIHIGYCPTFKLLFQYFRHEYKRRME